MATWKKIITSGSNAHLNNITASAGISVAGVATFNDITVTGLANQGSEATAVVINGSDVVGTRELGSNAFTSTTIGTTTNALTVDNTTLQLNSGTTFDGSAARTISVKDGGIDSDALADNISLTNLTASANISASGTITANQYGGNVSGSSTSTGSFGKLLGDGSDLTGIIRDIDDLDALGGTGLHQTQDHFVFSDNGTEKKITFSNLEDAIFGNVSGDATIAAGGALSLADNSVGNDEMADNAIGNAELKQDDDITLQSLTTTNNITVGGDLTVNGTTTTVATTNTNFKDQFIFLASGSDGTNVDSGIIVQSGSSTGTGSAFYHDNSDKRWSVAKTIAQNATAAQTPLQFVTTVKVTTASPTTGDYGIGEMHIDTNEDDGAGNGTIYIRTA